MLDDTESINRVLDEWQAEIDHEENFRRLFQRYYHRLHRFFQTRHFSTDECDDLTQETFFRVYSGMGTFRGEARFETWLLQIAVNTYRQMLRRQSAQRRAGPHVSWERAGEQEQVEAGEDELDHLTSAWGPLDEVLEEERRRMLCEAIESLPEQMRQCVTLRVYQEMSYREIAAIMEVSVETVKSHLSQARQRLRERLAEYFSEG